MNRLFLQRLSRTRLAEAKALLKLDHFGGAYYLAGYSVEFALKSVIARSTARYDFPDKDRVNASYTHDLSKLVRTALLEPSRIELSHNDPIFSANWTLVADWNTRARYAEHQQAAATALIEAISQKRHGVMAWLIQHW